MTLLPWLGLAAMALLWLAWLRQAAVPSHAG